MSKAKKKNADPGSDTSYRSLLGYLADDRKLNKSLIPVVIETPQGCRNKFDYAPDLKVFAIGGVLPAGAVFPRDFGFVPYTLGDDGDPLDVLLFMDQPAFPGIHLCARLVGVMEAKQSRKDGKMERNDRLVAVSATSLDHQGVTHVDDLESHERGEIEHFFVSYNESRGKKFVSLGWRGPKTARKILEEGRMKFEGKKRG